MDHAAPESPLKRQADIAKCLSEFILKEIANIIGSYVYHLEGVAKKLVGPKNILGVLSDGRILCRDSFDIFKVWNIDSIDNNFDIMFGEHNNGQHCWMELPNNTVAIGYSNESISIYYIGATENTVHCSISGKECRLPYMTLCGHDGSALMCMEYISDNLIVSGGYALKIWNIQCDDYLHQKEITKPYLVLEERTDPTDNYLITVLSVLSNTRIASGSIKGYPARADDSTIKIWNITNGECESVLRGHENIVCRIMPMFDHYVVSWSYEEGKTKIWNINLNNNKNNEKVEIKADITIADCYPVNHCTKRYKCSNSSSKFFTQKSILAKSLSPLDNTIKIFDCEKNYDFETNSLKHDPLLQSQLQPITFDITLEENFSNRAFFLILPDDRIFGPADNKHSGLKIRDQTGSDLSMVLQSSGDQYFELLPDGRVISQSLDGIKIWH